MKITRNGQDIELTTEELKRAYYEGRPLHMMTWIEDLLEEYGYPEQDEKTVADITERYLDIMEGGYQLGELEHESFIYAMDHYFDHIKADEA